MGILTTASPTFTMDDDSSPPDDDDSVSPVVTSPRPSPGLPITFDTFTPPFTTPPLSNTHANIVSYLCREFRLLFVANFECGG